MDYRNNGNGRGLNEAVTKGLCTNELIRIIPNCDTERKIYDARERDISLPRRGLPVAVARP